MLDNQSACLFRDGRKHGDDNNQFHWQAFHLIKNAFALFQNTNEGLSSPV